MINRLKQWADEHEKIRKETIRVESSKEIKLRMAKEPSRLPVGVTEFHAWVDSFMELYEFPTKDMDSIKFAFATMIMHLGPTDDVKPKEYFYKALMAGAAKQVAGEVFREIKIRQEEARKAAEAAAALEASSNEQSGS